MNEYMTVKIFNAGTPGFPMLRDSTSVRVKRFTTSAVVAAMTERNWNFSDGGLYVATCDGHALVFRVRLSGVTAEQVT